MAKSTLFYILVLLATSSFLLSRLLTILSPTRPKPSRPGGRRNPHDPTHLLIVLGSGGHTAEMMAMLERAITHPEADSKLDMRDFRHRTWVVGKGDGISAERAREFEEAVRRQAEGQGEGQGGVGSYDVQVVPRARAIHQPLWSSPGSSLICLWHCLSVLTRFTGDVGQLDFPDLILCNGPATATILVFASVLLRYTDWFGCNSRGKMRTIYVESWARVKKLSLSGRLLEYVVDRFLVQWPELEKEKGRAQYMGILV